MQDREEIMRMDGNEENKAVENTEAAEQIDPEETTEKKQGGVIPLVPCRRF